MSEIRYGIAWSDDFKLGNDHVDMQHYRLFELVSELISACMDGSDTEKLKKTLDFLVEYTLLHFSDEEDLQTWYNFPEYERHKQLHEDFKVTVGSLVQSFSDSGSSTDLSNEVNKIVVRWLVNHIQREDKKIGEHIRKVAAGDINDPFI